MAAPRLALTGLLLVARLLVAAQDPWAVAVVSYVQGSAPYSGYIYPDSALGRPTVDTYEDFVSLEPTVTVVPAYPPWDSFELVSIGEGGELVLELGTPLTDDPAHPYGVDLLVFGNSMLTGSGLYDQYGNDPRTYTLPTADKIGVVVKPGVVSVSADGATWFDFGSGPTAANMLPTLGRVWTGGAWGDPTNPTIPPDPELAPANLAGMNLAELCRRYRGGAGGTGFDLADLVVPEGVTPPASFRYMKVSVPDDGNGNTARRTEIDAVTVVSPVDGFVRWQQDHFQWTGDPASEQAGSNPEGDGFDNWREYALGGDPHAVESDLPRPVLEADAGGFLFTLPLSAREAPWTVQITADLTDPDGWASLDNATVQETVFGDTVEKRFVPPESGGAFRLRLEEAPE